MIRDLIHLNGIKEHAVSNDDFTAEKFKATGHKRAKVITSITFYDLEDPHAFVNDINEALDDEGLWVVQMSCLPYVQHLAFIISGALAP